MGGGTKRSDPPEEVSEIPSGDAEHPLAERDDDRRPGSEGDWSSRYAEHNDHMSVVRHKKMTLGRIKSYDSVSKVMRIASTSVGGRGTLTPTIMQSIIM